MICVSKKEKNYCPDNEYFILSQLIFKLNLLCWLGYANGGRNILKHSSNPLGSLFVPFAFGLDWTGFSNIIDCLSKKYWRCIGATLGLWKGFQARSYMYTCERKAFPESKTLCLSWKGSELGPEPPFMKVCYFPSPSRWIQLYSKKTYKF